MSRDYQPMKTKQCYGCMNWDGTRGVDSAKKRILVDDRDYANCRYWHANKQGDDTCEQFNPIQ